jgi:Co/Zn/Cd efflux system component
MHRVPENVDLEVFDTRLRELPGVKCIHDVHVWMVGSKNVIATAHIVVNEINLVGEVLEKAKAVAQNLGIGHSTFQIEVDGIFNHAEETFGALHSRDEHCCSQPDAIQQVV